MRGGGTPSWATRRSERTTLPDTGPTASQRRHGLDDRTGLWSRPGKTVNPCSKRRSPPPASEHPVDTPRKTCGRPYSRKGRPAPHVSFLRSRKGATDIVLAFPRAVPFPNLTTLGPRPPTPSAIRRVLDGTPSSSSHPPGSLPCPLRHPSGVKKSPILSGFRGYRT